MTEKTNEKTPEEEKTDIFQTMDKADEEQIEAELKGAVAEEMVYSFPVGGRDVKGLSKAGTWAVMRAFNKAKGGKLKIVLSPVKDGLLTSTPDGYGFVANASLVGEDGTVLENSGGGAEANKNDARGRGSFALAIAVTKAQRNAIRSLLPDDIVKKYIEKWSKQQKVKQFFTKGGSGVVDSNKKIVCEVCGTDKFSEKSKEYYRTHPNVPILCWTDSQKRKAQVS